MNKTSKTLQNPAILCRNPNFVIQIIVKFLSKIRNSGSFDDFESKVNCWLMMLLMRNQLINCYNKRIEKRNTRYDDGNDADTVLDDRSKFRVDSYYSILDLILRDLRARIRIRRISRHLTFCVISIVCQMKKFESRQTA